MVMDAKRMSLLRCITFLLYSTAQLGTGDCTSTLYMSCSDKIIFTQRPMCRPIQGKTNLIDSKDAPVVQSV